jgi:biopolymer transport protein TolQ
MAVANLDFVDLFMSADVVVKSVIISLIVASVWSWALLIDKAFKLAKVKSSLKAFEHSLSSGRGLDDLAMSLGAQPKAAHEKLLVTVTQAWREQKGKVLNGSQGDLLVSQLDRDMNRLINAEADDLEDGLSVLATIATATPFIGLFGTVWGIMSAFSAIASQGDTNLATVAPAISEALFATALGLGAAIPAYMGFNLFNAEVARLVSRLEGFADELMVSVTRRLGDKVAS